MNTSLHSRFCHQNKKFILSEGEQKRMQNVLCYHKIKANHFKERKLQSTSEIIHYLHYFQLKLVGGFHTRRMFGMHFCLCLNLDQLATEQKAVKSGFLRCVKDSLGLLNGVCKNLASIVRRRKMKMSFRKGKSSYIFCTYVLYVDRKASSRASITQFQGPGQHTAPKHISTLFILWTAFHLAFKSKEHVLRKLWHSVK